MINLFKVDSLGEKRVGKTPKDRLKWVIEEFLRQDMELLREGEKQDLVEDLRVLIPPGWKTDKARRMDELTVPRLHTQIARGIDGLLASRQWKPPRGISDLALCKKNANQWLTGAGGEYEAIIIGVLNLILQVGHRLKSCGNTDCNKAFVAEGRQDYCSSSCSQKERDKKRR